MLIYLIRLQSSPTSQLSLFWWLCISILWSISHRIFRSTSGAILVSLLPNSQVAFPCTTQSLTKSTHERWRPCPREDGRDPLSSLCNYAIKFFWIRLGIFWVPEIPYLPKSGDSQNNSKELNCHKPPFQEQLESFERSQHHTQRDIITKQSHLPSTCLRAHFPFLCSVFLPLPFTS